MVEVWKRLKYVAEVSIQLNNIDVDDMSKDIVIAVLLVQSEKCLGTLEYSQG